MARKADGAGLAMVAGAWGVVILFLTADFAARMAADFCTVWGW